MATALIDFNANIYAKNLEFRTSGNRTISTQSGDLILNPFGDVDYNSKNIKGVGTVACGAITSTGILDVGSNNFKVKNIVSQGDDIINIGEAGDTVNIIGSTNFLNITNLEIADPLIELNKAGSDATSKGSGFNISNTAGVAGGFIKSDPTNGDHFKLKAPLNLYSLSTPVLSADDTVACINQPQSFVGIQTFSVAPVLSGASISANTIPKASLANGTASYVCINDGTGVLSSEQFLSKARGGLGENLSTLLDASTGFLKTTNGTLSIANPTATNIVNADISANAAIALSKLATGNNYYSFFNNASGVMTEASAMRFANDEILLEPVSSVKLLNGKLNFSNSEYDQILRVGPLQTTDATPLLLHQIIAGDNSCAMIKINLVANNKDAHTSNYINYYVTYDRTLGFCNYQERKKETYLSDAIDITVDVAQTGYIKFYITGVAATWFVWKAVILTVSQN